MHPLLFLALTHLNDPLHDLRLFLVNLLPLLLLLLERHLHGLPHELLLCTLLGLNHFFSHLDLLWRCLLLLLSSSGLLGRLCLTLFGILCATRKNLDCLLVELSVSFHHESFEGYEIVNCCNLIHDFFVQWIHRGFLAC